MNTKTCTKCGTTKPLNDYHNNKSRKDGKNNRCKECQLAATNAWRKANPERVRTYNREWYEGNKELHKKINRVWREANIDRVRDNDRAYREANKESRKAAYEAWLEKNRERRQISSRAWTKANKHRRRARKAHTVPQRWKRSLCPDHLCYWCGTTLTPNNTHIDHIMPISLGGQDTPDNTANTCAKCNLTKHNTHPLVWIARITTPDPVC